MITEIKMYVTGYIEDAHFHSIVHFGLIFLWNSLQSGNIFKVQKNVIRILRGRIIGKSCRDLFNP
jgi:hypothetical protein